MLYIMAQTTKSHVSMPFISLLVLLKSMRHLICCMYYGKEKTPSNGGGVLGGGGGGERERETILKFNLQKRDAVSVLV